MNPYYQLREIFDKLNLPPKFDFEFIESSIQPIPSDEEWEARRKRWQERRWLGEPEVIADDWLFETYALEDFGEF